MCIRDSYKPLKLSSMFSERTSGTKENVNHVVYQFHCNKDGCNASYIGYTTNSLKLRVSQHRYRPSKIFEHFKNEHGTPKPNIDISNFDILHRAGTVSYTHLRAHETPEHLVCRLLLEKKKKKPAHHVCFLN